MDASSHWLAIQLFMGLNALIFVGQLCLSFLTVSSIWRTSLLHRNLKFVLLAQSSSSCAFACSRLVQIGITYQVGLTGLLEVPTLGGVPLNFVLVFSVLFSNLIGHVLLIERVLATVFVRKYEQWKTPLFSLAWFISLTLLTTFNAYQQSNLLALNNLNVTTGIMVTFYAALLLTISEVFAFSLLGAHNYKRYKTWFRQHPNRHDLSERYQLLENVRTARQLAPTFALHFVNVLVAVSFPVLVYYQLIVDPFAKTFYVVLYFLAMAANNLLIEYSLLSRHPILHANVQQILNTLKTRLFCMRPHSASNQVSDENRTNGVRAAAIGMRILVPPFGEQQNQRKQLVLGQTEMERHFQILAEEWKAN